MFMGVFFMRNGYLVWLIWQPKTYYGSKLEKMAFTAKVLQIFG